MPRFPNRMEDSDPATDLHDAIQPDGTKIVPNEEGIREARKMLAAKGIFFDEPSSTASPRGTSSASCSSKDPP